MRSLNVSLMFFLACMFFSACTNSSDVVQKVSEASDNLITDQKLVSNANSILAPPDWAKDATIYEVNLRQYNEEGTFKSFIPHVTRLKDMGIDILLFMPIYPISKAKRNGELGNSYAVRDYTAVNEEEHGSLEDFKEMVAAIHRVDMKIILDYVPNHTGWDHEWITSHPEYYTKNKKGEIIDPINPTTEKSWGWTDVADLDYNNKEMSKQMVEDMKWWLTECDIDGYRMNVANELPNAFWDTCIPELMKTKKVFLLADSEVPHHRNVSGFAADYGNGFHHLMGEIVEGVKSAGDIRRWYQKNRTTYSNGYHINFTSNHVLNSKNGTEIERMGDGAEAFAVLAGTLDGMPLIYSGQEEPLKRRLKSFERDVIGFKNFDNADFYRTLLSLKKKNKALRNGSAGGEAKFWDTNNNDVIAYSRIKDGDVLLTIINLSSKQHSIEMLTSGLEGAYNNVYGSSTNSVASNSKFNLKPWDYLVLSKIKR